MQGDSVITLVFPGTYPRLPHVAVRHLVTVPAPAGSQPLLGHFTLGMGWLLRHHPELLVGQEPQGFCRFTYAVSTFTNGFSVESKDQTLYQQFVHIVNKVDQGWQNMGHSSPLCDCQALLNNFSTLPTGLEVLRPF